MEYCTWEKKSINTLYIVKHYTKSASLFPFKLAIISCPCSFNKHCYLGVSRLLKKVLGSQEAATFTSGFPLSLLPFSPLNTSTPTLHPRPDHLAWWLTEPHHLMKQERLHLSPSPRPRVLPKTLILFKQTKHPEFPFLVCWLLKINNINRPCETWCKLNEKLISPFLLQSQLIRVKINT